MGLLAATSRSCEDEGVRVSLNQFAQNQLWCEIAALACELLAWTQLLAPAGQARRWEPRRLRLRIFAVAAAWPAAAAACGFGSPIAGPGPGDHRRDRPPARSSLKLTSRNSPDGQEGEHQGP